MKLGIALKVIFYTKETESIQVDMETMLGMKVSSQRKLLKKRMPTSNLSNH